jgi:hypothetical protein
MSSSLIWKGFSTASAVSRASQICRRQSLMSLFLTTNKRCWSDMCTGVSPSRVPVELGGLQWQPHAQDTAWLLCWSGNEAIPTTRFVACLPLLLIGLCHELGCDQHGPAQPRAVQLNDIELLDSYLHHTESPVMCLRYSAWTW